MAKFKNIQNTFSQGMLSPKLRGRTDLKEFYQGAENIVNYLGYKQGGVYRRPGSIWKQDFSVLTYFNGVSNVNVDFGDQTLSFIPYNDLILSGTGNTGSPAALLIDPKSGNNYEVTVGKEYNGDDIILAPGTILNDGFIDDRPYLDGFVDYAQNGELLFITRTNKPPLVLYKWIAEARFPYVAGQFFKTGYKLELATVPIDQYSEDIYDPSTTFEKEETLLQPYIPSNIVAGKTATPSATTGTINILFSFKINLPIGSLVKITHGAVTGVARITSQSYTTPIVTNFGAEVLINFGSATASDNWQLSSWAVNGNPTNVCFYEQRLIYSRNEKLYGSLTGNFQKFMIRRLAQDTSSDSSGLGYFGETKVTDPFEFGIASKEFQNIKWLQGGEVLEVGTDKGEYAVFGTQGQILSNENVNIQQQTNFGSAHCKGLKANKETIFISDDRLSIRSFIRSGNTSTYDTEEIMALSEDIYLGEEIVDLHYQNAANIVWMRTASGKMKAMTLNRIFGIRSFIDIEMDGEVKFSTVSANLLTMVVKRGSVWSMVTIGTEFKGADLTGDDFTFMDQSINFDQASSTTVSGLSHLEGETIDLIGDGVLYEDLTVSGGQVTVPTAVEKGCAGLRFSSYIKTFNLEAGGAFGNAQGEKKRINELQIKFYRSYKGKIGKDLSQLDTVRGKEFQFQSSPSTIPLETIDIDQKVGVKVSFNNSVVIGQFQSLPSNILAIVYKGVTYDE
jgi:hypothetical protein